LLSSYQNPDGLPWRQIAGALVAAEDALARLDERLARSPIREGWIARTHFTDACASLWLEGELVHLEDLVLHDAGMDVRAPTHDLGRARAVLRARRRIAQAEPDWTLSSSGLSVLRGRRGERDEDANTEEPDMSDGEEIKTSDLLDESEPRLAAAVAAVDAANAKALRALAEEAEARRERAGLIYDPDWDENSRLEDWLALVDNTRSLPATLAAAIAGEAWTSISPLQHTPWLGRLLVASLLRARGKTRWYLPCLHVGLKAIRRERRRSHDPAVRLAAQLEAMTAAAAAGLKDHDRWLNARMLLLRKLEGRRSTSSLPALIEYVFTRPLVSAGMIARELDISARAAQDLVGKLGLREATGRGRYRAWGIP
jgi:hypothetical protein